MTIANLSDLYVLFGAESFADLNRRIYEDTSCGASISIYGTLPTAEASPQARSNAQAAGLRSMWMAEYERILATLTEAYKQAPTEAQEHIAAADAQFHQGTPMALVAWARTVVPGAFPVTDIAVPDRIPVAYHSGHYDPIPASFVFMGFTIQTIVEGSDAEVNSVFFPLGTTKAEVDAWIEYMECEADHLWREANGEDENTEDDN
jgi:hypothetical protein